MSANHSFILFSFNEPSVFHLLTQVIEGLSEVNCEPDKSFCSLIFSHVHVLVDVNDTDELFCALFT